jgi:hypothetical protein
MRLQRKKILREKCTMGFRAMDTRDCSREQRDRGRDLHELFRKFQAT